MRRTVVLTLSALVLLAPPPATQAQGFSEDVIEITGPVLAGFMKGIDTEIALLYEFGKLLATYKGPEEYGICQAQMGASPEGMKIAAQFASLPENATMEQMQRVTEKMGREFAALSLKVCGPDPADWHDVKRREKIEEIQTKAAAAADPVGSFDADPAGGPAAIDDPADHDREPERRLSLLAFLIMKERIDAYCNALAAGTIQAGQGVKFPGNGKDVFWVYTDAEAMVIAPQCPDLMRKSRIALEMGEIIMQQDKITLGEIDVIMQLPPIKIQIKEE